MSRSKQFIPPERIDRSILLLRGRKVMLSTHLAALYDVEPLYKAKVDEVIGLGLFGSRASGRQFGEDRLNALPRGILFARQHAIGDGNVVTLLQQAAIP